MSTLCTSSQACLVHKRYDQTKSSTFSDPGGSSVNIQYGTGEVTAVPAVDVVNLASIVIPNQQFLETINAPGQTFAQVSRKKI